MFTKAIHKLKVVLLLSFFTFGNLLANEYLFNPTDTTFLNIQLCESECPLPNGWPCLSDSYEEILVGSNGCDSLVITTVTVFPTDSTFQQIEICEGDCPLPNGLPCVDGTYVQSLINGYGCDSLLTR